MQLYVIQDDLIVPVDGGPAFARVSWGNPLAQGVALGGEPESRLVSFSGWLGGDDEEADPRAGVFPQDFRTWMPEAWGALDALCDELRPRLESGGQVVCFRPHARHILADPQACLSFLRRRAERGSEVYEVLLDAAAFLTAGMLGRVEDHLRRAYEAMAGHPRVPAVVLANVEAVGGAEDEGALRPVGLTRGRLEAMMLVGLAREHATHLPWVLLPEDLEGQLALLRG